MIQISLMSKLVPSPDWFVGVDSLDVCHNGQFADSISRHLDPHDGGTDNGFTFTSPNWPTEPRGVIFTISSQYPTHPAGSFYYPHLEKLPNIATIHIKKVTKLFFTFTYSIMILFFFQVSAHYFVVVMACTEVGNVTVWKVGKDLNVTFEPPSV